MCDVREAQYVMGLDLVVRKIKAKWGISKEGHLEKPSKGGFGCVTEDAIIIDMWHAQMYFKDLQEALDARQEDQRISFAFDRPQTQTPTRIRTKEAGADMVEERLPQSSGGVRYAD